MGKYPFRRSDWLRQAVLQGILAWGAYGLVEFFYTAVLFRLARPFITITTWQWRPLGLFAAAYLAIGVLIGLAIGLILSFVSNREMSLRPVVILRHAATFTVVLSFGIHLLLADPSHLIYSAVVIGFLAALVSAMVSEQWSNRLGWVTYPWIVLGIILGAGKIDAVHFLSHNGMPALAARPYLVPAAAAALAVIGLASMFIGRGYFNRLAKDRLSVIDWVPLICWLVFLAGALIAGQSSIDNRLAGRGVVAGKQQPNILLVVMDTVRADHLSSNGYKRDTTPHLRQLAAESTVYTNAIAPSDYTLATHGSLFTGLYPSVHGAHCRMPDAAYGVPLDTQVPTLAETLKRLGYTTVGVAANTYLKADFGLQRGFESFQIPRNIPLFPEEDWYLLRRPVKAVLSRFVETGDFDRLYARADKINLEFVETLRAKSNPQRPFFGFLNYMDAHHPYSPPEPYDTAFPGQIPHLNPIDAAKRDGALAHGTSDAVYVNHLISQYDGGIAFADAQIGNLVDWLKQNGLYENTMIIVTSDHGEAFGEKGLLRHGNAVYQNVVHVGLLIKYAQGERRGTVDVPVSLVDLLPTIMAQIKGPSLKNLPGVSLLNPLPSRFIYSESFPCPAFRPPDCPEGCLNRAVYSWPKKLIVSSSGKRELYDLSKDGNETSNLYSPQDTTSQALSSTLQDWVRGLPKVSRKGVTLDHSTQDLLKGLGYVK